MNQDELYKRARKRVKKLKEFYSHLAVYLLVISFLCLINLATARFPWVIFPAGGWGIGLAMHGFDVLFDGWEERKIQELMAQEGHKPKRKNDDDYFETN